MASVSTLPPSSLHASKAALASAVAEQPPAEEPIDAVEDEAPESPEAQEFDMQAQAEGIRTVFNDPTNFNVKVLLNA
jgi:translation initiation factor 4E